MNDDNGREVVLFRIDRKAGILVVAFLTVTLAGLAIAETLTLATSYPVPSGIYNQLITTGNAGSSPQNTTLNLDAGNTILAPASNAAGRVGIGTSTPSEKLSVVGSVSIVDGTQGLGKVLTSDNGGRASWQYCTFAP